MKRRTDLTTPRQRRRVGIHYDPDAFGSFSESIARFLGTGERMVATAVSQLERLHEELRGRARDQESTGGSAR